MKRPNKYMTMTDGVTLNDYVNDLSKYIDHLEKQSNWISVDTPPEHKDNHFVRLMVCRFTQHKVVFEAMYNPVTGDFQNLNFDKLDHITHYQYKPSPPKN